MAPGVSYISKNVWIMKKVYISGRISDLPREQYMVYFQKVEELLKDDGFSVVNPTKFWFSRWYGKLERIVGGETAYRVTLLYDLLRLMKCDLIYKLPGWQQSRGANIESCVAYHMKVWPVSKKIVSRMDKAIEKMIIRDESKPKTKK